MESQRQSEPEAKSESQKHHAIAGRLESAVGLVVPAVDTVRADGGRLPSPTQAVALQRTVGNRATTRLLARRLAPPVQRHPEGATVLGGLGVAGGGVQELLVANGGKTDGGTPTTDGGSGGTGGTEGTSGGTPSGPTPTPDGGGGGTTTDGGTTTTDGGTTPAPTSTTAPSALTIPTLKTAFAQNALQTSFGDAAPKKIITGNITVVADRAALYAKYDQWMIAHNMTDSSGNPWTAGEKRRVDDAGGFRMNAFAEPEPSTDIYIDATQTDPTATVHEMLHVNTANGFISTVGRAINEGITQRFAAQAISASGNSLAGSENTYQAEQRVVEALIKVVGEPIVRHAYFNGAATLLDTYQRLMGADTFALLNSTLNPDTQAGYDAAVLMLVPPGVTQRIASIKAILNGWWVSGDDFQMIASIVDAANATERMQIYSEIEPLVKSLWTEEKRSRLRQILMRAMPAVHVPSQGDTVTA
jgi:hypothetical protein